VTATFSEAINAATLTGTTFTLVPQGGSAVSAALTCNNPCTTATLTPNAPLAVSKLHTATVKGGAGGVTDTSGNALAVDKVWSFTTSADGTPPTVTTVSPAAGAVGVLVTSAITATFSENMAAGTISGTTFTLVPQGGSAVAAAVSCNNPCTTATLAPTAPLAANTLYTATVKGGAGGVTDTAGNALAVDKGWTFTTNADAIPPTVTTVSPVSGAAGVFVTSSVTATFSENMAAGTISGTTFTLVPQGGSAVAATVSCNNPCTTATLTPGAPLAANKLHTATVKSGASGVTDTAGNPLAADKIWTFTTNTDGTAPTVTTVSPVAGATGVATSTAVTATFSETVATATVSGTTFTLVPQGGSAVAAAVACNNPCTAATLTPSASLAAGVLYTATVKGGAAGVTDLAGNSLAVDKVWTFTTAGTVATTYLSDLVPTSSVNGWGPVERDMSNGENAAGDGHVLTLNGITFAKGLGTHAASDIRYALNGSCTSFLASVGLDDEAGAGGSVIFQVFTDGTKRFDSGLMIGTTATQSVNVDVTGVTQLQLVVTDGGNGTSSDHGDWADAKVSCVVSPPTVTAITPPDATTGLTATVNPAATFSKAMDTTTVNASTVTLKQGAASVTATVAYDAASRTVTLRPAASLAASTPYTVTIKGGSSGVKDSAGNPLASDSVWTFTTAAASAFLSDRPWITAVNGWGPVERDKSNGENGAGDGHPITLRGVVYAKGLGVHAASDIRFPLNGVCTSVTATVGIDDEVAAGGSVVFQVLIDGVKQYDSGVVTRASAAKSVYVGTAGATELGLIVTDGGDGNSADHSDWANVQVACSPDNTAPTVTTVSPANGATGVSTLANATATFSEAMDPATFTTTTVTLLRGATPVTVSVSYDPATKVVTVHPNAALTAGATHTVTIKSGSAGVKDLAGNPLAADRTWTFTTQ
jgi:hypothetical protein